MRVLDTCPPAPDLAKLMAENGIGRFDRIYKRGVRDKPQEEGSEGTVGHDGQCPIRSGPCSRKRTGQGDSPASDGLLSNNPLCPEL